MPASVKSDWLSKTLLAVAVNLEAQDTKQRQFCVGCFSLDAQRSPSDFDQE